MTDKLKEMHEKVSKVVSPVYIVGGAVRDALLGQEPKDYDFSTPLSPDEIEAQIVAYRDENGQNRRVYTTGKKYGTLGFRLDGELIEVTTFRTEKYNKGSRKPEVEFVKDIIADLSRRDFTINAMAFDGEKIIDPFGGRLDIMKKKIICVSNATERFKEDALRMLRAGRFASKLGFDIDQDLEKRAGRLAYTILNISVERWVMELDKILMSDNPSVGLDFLMRTKIMKFILPEVAQQLDYEQDSPYHDFTLWEHTKKVVENTPKEIELRWAALLHDIGKPVMRYQKPKKDYPNYVFHEKLGAEMSMKIALYLRWSTDRMEKVYNLIKYHLREESPLKDADDRSKLCSEQTQ